jgi:hydroxyacylglutathione hydrolase
LVKEISVRFNDKRYRLFSFAIMKIQQFTFNPFQENSFVLYDETKECVIIDPGCYTQEEKEALKSWITENELKPVKLLSTHSHLDHVFGNAFVKRTFDIPLYTHKNDIQTQGMLMKTANMYNIPGVEESPKADHFFTQGDIIKFGDSELEVRFVPGHAPGHVVFVAHDFKFVINGDCLFNGSIGRVDLPGGDGPTLIKSIKEQLFSLPDDYTVFCGHGPETTIGSEKVNNPYFNGQISV